MHWSLIAPGPDGFAMTLRESRCHQIQEGALLSECTDPEQGGGGPESKRANLPKVVPFYLLC